MDPDLRNVSGDLSAASLRSPVVALGNPGGLTPRKLFVLSAINFIDGINTTILVPYIDAFVSNLLHERRDATSVALWASILVGSYSGCEVAFSGLWGMLSDRIGRRPVLLIGLAGSAAAPVLFGMSHSLWAALAARLLDGFFCGNAGVTRTYLGEIVDESNEAQAFGMLSLVFSIALLVGPGLGGLVEPAVWCPSVFAGTLFDYYPYLLPNAIYSAFAVASLIIGIFALDETSSFLCRQGRGNDLSESLVRVSVPTEDRRSRLWPSEVVELVMAFSLLNGYVAARIQGYVLVVSFPRDVGGFAFGPRELAYIQMFSAVIIFFTNQYAYPFGLRRFGEIRCFVVGLALTVCLTLPFPLYGLLADSSRFGFWRYVPICVWQGCSQMGFTFCFPIINILINRGCEDYNRGAINGWANSLSALSRGVFPLVAGGLVALGRGAENMKPHGIPGGRYLVFYVNCLPAFLCMWLVGKQGLPTSSR